MGKMATWTPEQQKEHRRLWVEALRSGKYQQAKNRLRVANGFCCLGVACDISGLGEWSGSGFYLYEDDKLLPIEVRNWLGLSGCMGGYGQGDKRAYLSDQNDEGMSFSEIADIIESEPEGLLAPVES